MRIFFTTTVWLLTVSGSIPFETENNKATLKTACNSTALDRTAYVGDSVSITCNYSQRDDSSIRRFCRHDGNFTCTNVISTRPSVYAKLRKVSLRDDQQQGAYIVKIAALTQEDSGNYWCTLETDNSITCLRDVHLHVLNPGTEKMGKSPPQPEHLATPPQVLKKIYQNERSSGSGSTRALPSKSQGDDKNMRNGSDKTYSPGTIAGIVCGVIAVIVMVVIILILCRKKLFCKRASGGASEQKINTVENTEKNYGDHQYDDIRIQDKQTNAVSTLYSTVNPPAEHLHYASINIHSGESAGNDKNASSDSNNSFEGAANPPAETTLYSTVAKLGE